MSSMGPFPTSMAKVISEGAETRKETGKKMKGVVSAFRAQAYPERMIKTIVHQQLGREAFR